MPSKCVGAIALLLASVSVGAYESDIHFSATYVIARAVGFASSEALTIASANEGLDENRSTVAALQFGVKGAHNFVHQAPKNFTFHCFGETEDQKGAPLQKVRQTIDKHLNDANLRTGQARLIAVGVALHCLQDAHSHSGFGGTCEGQPGSCAGHVIASAFDRGISVLISEGAWVKRANPDHPAHNWDSLSAALRETRDALSRFSPALKFINDVQMEALVRTLSHGSDFQDEKRMECNHFRAAGWLLNLSGRVTEQQTPMRFGCGQDTAGGTTLLIPSSKIPLLDARGQPEAVTESGYREVVNGKYDAYLPRVIATQEADQKGQTTYEFKIQYSGLIQGALAHTVVRIMILQDETGASFGADVPLPAYSLDGTLTHRLRAPSGPSARFVAVAELVPREDSSSEDCNIGNDQLMCLYDSEAKLGLTVWRNELTNGSRSCEARRTVPVRTCAALSATPKPPVVGTVN